MESDIPMIYSPKAIGKAFYKCKRSTNEPSTAKNGQKIKTNANFLEKMSRSTKLHLLRDNDLITRVKYEKIKQIFEKNWIFGALFFELYTVL